jgi:hypothetical protein
MVDGPWLIAGAASAGVSIGVARAVWHRHRTTKHLKSSTWDEATTLTVNLLSGNRSGVGRLTNLVRETPAATIDAIAVVCRRTEDEVPRWPAAMAQAISDWIKIELVDPEPTLRRRALELVGSLRLTTMRAEVIERAADEDEGVRIAACRCLVAIDPETAVGVLLGIVEEQGMWAANLLVSVVDRLPSQSGAIVRRVREWTASPALVTLVGELASPAAVGVLHNALGSTDELVAHAALIALLGRPEALPKRVAGTLVALLSADDAAIRRSAAIALGRTGSPTASVALAGAIGDGDRSVRFAAAEALMKLPNGVSVLGAIVEGGDEAAVEAARVALWASGRDSELFPVELAVG